MTFAILFSIQDEKTKTSTTEVKLPGATDFDDARLFAGELAKLIDPLVTGAITRIGLVHDLDLSTLGLTPAAAANSDVEEGARFQFRTEGGFYSGLRLPTFDEALIAAGSRAVDVEDTAVAAFITAMRTGINLTGVGGSGVIQPCDSREEDLTALEFAREQFQSSRG